MTPEKLARAAEEFVDSGAFFTELATMVAYATESARPEGRLALEAYLDEVLTPALTALGCTVTRHRNPSPAAGPFLVGRRVEDPALPTVLCYGHADVVEGMAGQWSEDRDPWTLTADGDRWYGRGAADNKGQHLVNLAALRILLAEQGALGFNMTFLFDPGEEIGSPGLAEFAAAHQELLRADLLLGSDGPRLDEETPTLFLGARGGVQLLLDADLRPGAHHSGNRGGVLRNPATTLAAAIATLVDGHGRILVPELLPPPIAPEIREALTDVQVDADPHWGEPELTPAERLYAWNTLEVLAISAGDTDRPVGAIPGRARAILQLRHVAGTDANNTAAIIAAHLATHGYPMIDVTTRDTYPASRTPLDDPWARWARPVLDDAAGRPITVLPNIGGSLPNAVFTDILALPTLWLPHSYPGCRQHATDEHLPMPIAREGLKLTLALLHTLANPPQTHPLPARTQSP